MAKILEVTPVAFDAAWVLVALVLPNHRVHRCSGASVACHRRATSIPLGIQVGGKNENANQKNVTVLLSMIK